MNQFQFELLDTSNSAAVLEYESAFYDSFSAVESNRLARKLWLWDNEAGRIRTRIPYESQLICALRDQNGHLQSAMAFNVALRQFQSASFGFAVPLLQKAGFEVLTFFTITAQTLDVCSHFWSRCLGLLKGRGLTCGYATTARRPLPMYRRVGWEILEEREIESEKRYFLHYKRDQQECATRNR